MTAGQRLGVAWGTLVLVALGVVLWSVTFPVSGSNTPAALPSNDQSSVPLLVTAIAKLEPLAWTQTPTPTSTATVTPVPSATQRAVWVPDPCSTPEPGVLCRVPDRAPNTPTPYPSCYGAVEPGKWCRWEIADDAPDGRTEVQ